MPSNRSPWRQRLAQQALTAAALLAALLPAAGDAEPDCGDRQAGQRNLYWGDLHVHTAFSMDAYAFGNRRDPGDAFAYARGQSLLLADGKTLSTLRQPLDFMAVTDHAETFDVMYLCSDPRYLDNDYCAGFRAGSNPSGALDIFNRYLLTLITPLPPPRSPLCAQDGIDCDDAARRQWRRSQEFANAANAPCEFTALIGNEWSATPGGRHWHRNLIFASESVTRDALDYLRYPDVGKLWNALEEQCDPGAGCEVITIPHNTNMSEAGNFAIENDSDRRRHLRMKYERLVEVYQSKGNSECLPEQRDEADGDCNFEIVYTRTIEKAMDEGTFSAQDWALLRGGYVRHLLSRGLGAYAADGPRAGNPLQLGIIGSTDNHTSTPGNTAEDNWKGDVWSSVDDAEDRFRRLNYNPGGLVAVWAEQNTRADLFAALKNRRVYGTSGTRIGLRFMAGRELDRDSCRGPLPAAEAEMGGSIAPGDAGQVRFLVQASMDRTPLARVDIVKGFVVDGESREQVTTVFEDDGGRSEVCVQWTDTHPAGVAAYWYARVLEQPTPRWSRLDCLQSKLCNEYPGADRMIRERAWSSPIWNLP